MIDRSRAPSLKDLPSVDQIMQEPAAIQLIAEFGRAQVLQAVRESLVELRGRLRSADPPASMDALAPGSILHTAAETLESLARPSLVKVINATGVILHTNLGRAPLSRQAVQAIQAVSLGYNTLEYDLERGVRGSRRSHAEALLRRLTGAEAALVVNNNASALLLALVTLAQRKRVIIARSQLVEIGGGFRIPDVMRQSGARLVEVGTTNRVHPSDFAEALQEPAALVLHVHSSNYRIIGFTSEPALEEMVSIAHQHEAIVLDDLGSGVLLDTARYGLAHEPTVQESLAAGADLVCFSGDKLLGGPQAGILLGKSTLIARIAKHPLARAVRADKLCLAGLSATLTHYLKDEAEREIPIWQMISSTPAEIEKRALHWAEALGQGEVAASYSTVGGGSLPGETLPTFVLSLKVNHPNSFLARLRRAPTPVIARVEDDRVCLDPRTVFLDEEETLLDSIRSAFGRRI